MILDTIKSAWDWLCTDGLAMLKDLGMQIWNWISDPALWEAIGQWIKDAVQAICDGLLALWDWICDLLSDPEFWSKLWDILVWIFDFIIDLLGTIWSTVFSIWGKILGLIWDGLKWVVEKIWDGIKWVGEKIWDGIKWVGQKIGDFFKWIGKIFSDWWQKRIVKPISGFFKKIKEWNDAIKAKIREQWRGFVNNLKKFWEMIKSIPSRIYNAVTGMVTSVKEKFSSIIESIKQKFWGFVEAFKDKMQGMVDTILHAIPDALGGMSDEEYAKRNKERENRAKERDGTGTAPAKQEAPKPLVTPAAPVDTTIDISKINQLTQTEISNINNNNQSTTNSSNKATTSNTAAVQAQLPKVDVNIVPPAPSAPMVNVEAANDEVQHDLTKKQTKAIDELNDTMRAMAENQQSGGNVTTMTVVNNNGASNVGSTVTVHQSSNDNDARRLRGSTMN